MKSNGRILKGSLSNLIASFKRQRMSTRDAVHRLFPLSAVVAGLSIGIAGCGGGGGGGSSGPIGPVASTSLFPLDAAASNFEQISHGFTLNATDSSSNTYTFSFSITPGASSSFEGHPALTASTSVVLKKNGVTIATGSGTDYFQVGPLTSLGTIVASGDYIVTSASTALPSSATVGQSGAFVTGVAYTSSAKTTVDYNATVTWSLEADTANTAWLCTNETDVFTNADPSYTESDCYKVDPSGNFLGAKVTISQAGTTLVFQ